MVNFAKKSPADANGQVIFTSKRSVNLPLLSNRGGGTFRFLFLREPVISEITRKGEVKDPTKKPSYGIESLNVESGKHGIYSLHAVSHSELARHYPFLRGLAFKFEIPAEKSPGKDYKVPIIEEIDLEGHEEYINDLLSRIVPPTTLDELRRKS